MESIELSKEHLNKGGIMAHWVPLPGIGSGVDDLETHIMLIRTFAKVFPYTYTCRSLNSVGLHMIGSMGPINISIDAIRDKLSNTAVSYDINEWERVPFEFLVSGYERLPAEYAIGPFITDNKPYLEFYLLRILRNGGRKMHPENSLW